MPMFGTPVVSSRSEPVRAARIPEKVRLAIITMVEEGEDFVSAGKRHGVAAQMMRRWLGRAEAISFLRAERSRFRQSVCAANESYLVAIRSGDNGAAAVRAIQVLESLDEQGSLRRVGEPASPGVTIRIVNVSGPSQPPAIDIAPRAVVSSHGLPNQDE
jgi:hypothetical protein